MEGPSVVFLVLRTTLTAAEIYIKAMINAFESVIKEVAGRLV